MRHFRKLILFTVSIGLFVTISGESSAATQSLALLETDRQTPLHCQDGVCKAEFSTYCLQQERDLPRTGDPYTVAQGGALVLVLTASDGTVRRIPAAAHVRIAAARSGHTAVTIALDRTALGRHGAERVAIEVGARVALMPVPFAGDDNPQTEQDKRLANGPLREVGEAIVDRGPHDVARVRELNQLINALPNGIDRKPSARQSLWQRAADKAFRNVPDARIEIAKQEYAACWRDRVVELGGYSVRHCLQRRHDSLMWQHVKRYWDAVGAGS